MKKIVGISAAAVIIVGLIAFAMKDKEKPLITDTNLQQNVASATKQSNQPKVELIGPNKVPSNTLVFNNNIAPPDGKNKFPTIVPPGNNLPPAKIGAPPEAIYLTQCQAAAKGNPEVSRKCFENIVASLVTNAKPTIQASNPDSAYANKYLKYMDEKIAYCKTKSPINSDAFKFCVNTQSTELTAQNPSAQFMQVAQTTPTNTSTAQGATNSAPQPQKNNPYAIYK
jgi:hypothetical protein